MANSYVLGQQIRLSADFKNLAGALTDPTTVTFKVESPAGVVTMYVYGTDSQVVKDATGQYHVDYLPATAGWWNYRWEGSGSLVTADEEWLEVEASRL